LLFEQDGALRVLLTTRAKHLRAHPGQTALPGGKVDDDDADYVRTAVRPPSTRSGPSDDHFARTLVARGA
jgi:coenzyme A diphosphatase NUDT7